MAKAIIGAAMIVGAIGLTVLTGGASSLLVLAGMGDTMAAGILGGISALVGMGISMEAAAVGEALSNNRGVNISTRQAAGFRQIVYGQQRIGGTVVYQSTTGAGSSSTANGNYLYNYVIALASHEIDSVVNIYLDGRQVYWSQTANSSGYHANIGCGSVSNPPTTSVTISGGVITGITATGGSGFTHIKPCDGFRVRIYDSGGGSGAEAWATNSGAGSYGTDFVVGTWTITVVHGGSGYTSATVAEVQGAYTFGGAAANDQQDPLLPGYGLGYGIGPGGPHYQFAGSDGNNPKVYCEARFGDQRAGDYMASLSYNDATWPTTANMGGIAYLYVNIGYDTTQFQNAPEIRITVNGKNNIFDPRTSKTGFSTNWALQVADVITDPVWGLGDNTVNQAQLIAAANVCDELISTSQGDESRYQQHIHYDTSSAPGDVLSMMMPAAAGRLSRIGGEWYIFPAYWQGSSFGFDDSTLVGDVQWTPYRSFKDLVNCVNGTYIAPNYPYAVAGNLYDANGWYYGTTANLWPYAWQPTNYPQYAQDVLHGYSANEWLVQDGGTVLPRELALRGVISVVQAQRLAKIALLRNRQQGSGVFPMSLLAWQMQPLDVMSFSFSQMGWSSKYLEIDKIQLAVDPMSGDAGEDGPLAITCSVSVQETDPSVYEWNSSDELSPYDVPAIAQQIPYTPAPPTSMTVLSNAGTAIINPDGTVISRALIQWDAPNDITVTGIDVQYQLVGAPPSPVVAAAVVNNNLSGGGALSQYVAGTTVSLPTSIQFEVNSNGGIIDVLLYAGAGSPGPNGYIIRFDGRNTAPAGYMLRINNGYWGGIGTTLTTNAGALTGWHAVTANIAAGGQMDVYVDGVHTATATDTTYTPTGALYYGCEVTTGAILAPSGLTIAGGWQDAGTVNVGLFEAFVGPLVAGSSYNFQIRSVRPSGSVSGWVSVSGVTAGITLSSSSTTGSDVAPPGTLIALALSGGTANIVVNPFTANIGGLTASCLSTGAYTISGLTQGQNYYVYYIDHTFAGGAITPIATTTQSDYLNKVGYFFIGSITTPVYTVRYAPSAFATSGASTVSNPANAYDNNLATYATLPSYWFPTLVSSPPPVFTYNAYDCSCTWSAFPTVTTGATTTLNVILSATESGTVPAMSIVISASVSGTGHTLATLTSAASETTYTLSIPSGTNLSGVTVTVSASITAGSVSTQSGSAVAQCVEIYIQ